MSDLFALQVGQLLIGARRLDHGNEVVTAHAFADDALRSKRYGASEVDGEACRAGREAGEMQPARAHGLDLGGVRLDRIVDDPLASAGGEMVTQRLKNVGVDGRIFDGRIGPNQRRRIFPLLRIGSGHPPPDRLIGVAIHRVELAPVCGHASCADSLAVLQPAPKLRTNSVAARSEIEVSFSAHRTFLPSAAGSAGLGARYVTQNCHVQPASEACSWRFCPLLGVFRPPGSPRLPRMRQAPLGQGDKPRVDMTVS